MDGLKEYSAAEFVVETRNRIKFLFSKWIYLVLSVLLGAIIGVSVKFLSKDEYIAFITFFNENNASRKQAPLLPSIMGQSSTSVLDDNPNFAFIGDNITEVFTSPAIIRQTLLDTFNLQGTNTIFIKSYISNHQQKFKAAQDLTFNANANRYNDSIMGLVVSEMQQNAIRLNFKDKKLNFITLEVQDVNEIFARSFMHQLTKNVIAIYTKYKIEKATMQVAMLQRNVDSLRQLVGNKLSTVANVTDQTINPAKQASQVGRLQTQAELQGTTALYTELNKQLLFSKINLEKEKPVLEITSSSNYPLERKRITLLNALIIFPFIAFFLTTICLLVSRQIRTETRP